MRPLAAVARLAGRFPVPSRAAPPRPALARAPSAPARARRRGRVRRSLGVSTAEGIAAELVAACTGTAAVTGWALHLGCGAGTIAALGALPFVAHVLQLPASRLTARLGARRVAVLAVALSRQAFLPLALLPFVPLSPAAAKGLLLGAAALHHGLGIVCNNGWTAWMGELVPRRVRGRYFGRRTAICTAAAAGAGLGAGLLLDAAPGGEGVALALLALVASAAGAASTALMARQHGGAPAPRRAGGPAPLAAALRDPAARAYAGFLAASGLGAGLAVPFLGVLVLRERALGFAFLAVHGAAAALARMVAAPRWGHVVDRPGGTRVALAASTAILALSPVAWTLAGPLGPALLLAEAVTGGIAAAGSGVAGFTFPLALSPPAERPAYHAVFALAGALSFAAGAAAGGALAALGLPGAAGALTAPFAASAVLRLGAAAYALRLSDGRAAGPARR